ncbi:MAG: hypothetical protein ACTSRP_09085 [Candidatus Helarchaeota archaeon]
MKKIERILLKTGNLIFEVIAIVSFCIYFFQKVFNNEAMTLLDFTVIVIIIAIVVLVASIEGITKKETEDLEKEIEKLIEKIKNLEKILEVKQAIIIDSYCNSCGKKIAKTDEYCKHCGAKQF